MKNDAPIQTDPAYLSSLVGLAFQNPRLVIQDWETHCLHGGFQLNSSILRLQGDALDGESRLPWSLVLKVIRPDPAYADPRDYRYWKREVLAYQSGLLNDLPGPVVAPRCYDICSQPDGSFWLFLEDIQEESDSSWSLEKYALVARALGEFNGAYLSGCSLPEAPWIKRDWLRSYLEYARPAVDFVRQSPFHPVVQDIFPGITLAEALAFWDVHPHLLQILERLPQAFSHQDAFERNLFLRNRQVVAIDWAYAGIAPVAAELAPLIAAAIAMGNFPASRAQELDKACFSAYLEGLRQTGWQPDEKQVRLGFTLTFGLRYTLGNTLGETIPTLLDQERRERLFEDFGRRDTGDVRSNPDIVAYYQSNLFEILRQLGPKFTFQLLARTVSYIVRLRRKQQPLVTTD